MFRSDAWAHSCSQEASSSRLAKRPTNPKVARRESIKNARHAPPFFQRSPIALRATSLLPKHRSSNAPRIHSVLSIILLIFTLAPKSALAESPPPLTLHWGSFGTNDGQFKSPNAVATDDFGHVYVTDFNNDRIQKFDSNGAFITKWGSSGSSSGSADGQFRDAYALDVDSFGNVYVIDASRNDVQVFDPDGHFLRKWGSAGSAAGQFNLPQGLAVDSANNVYVADTENHRVQKFDSFGTFVLSFGTFGSGPGQFKSSYGMDTDALGNVYVTDLGNRRVQKFDSDGNFLFTFGSQGLGDGQFAGPTSVRVAIDGSIYVADQPLHRIQKFRANGSFVVKWGADPLNQFNPGQLNQVRGLALDSQGTLYAADTGNNRIVKFGAAKSGR